MYLYFNVEVHSSEQIGHPFTHNNGPSLPVVRDATIHERGQSSSIIFWISWSPIFLYADEDLPSPGSTTLQKAIFLFHTSGY